MHRIGHTSLGGKVNVIDYHRLSTYLKRCPLTKVETTYYYWGATLNTACGSTHRIRAKRNGADADNVRAGGITSDRSRKAELIVRG